MTQIEFSFLEKQKQVYFVTQKIEGSHGYENMTYGLTIDCLLDKGNTYITLPILSDEIKAKKIMISPESLYDSLNNLNTTEIFENFPTDKDLLKPFKLKEKIYKDFLSTVDYITKLREYVENFLESSKNSITYRDKLIDILLDSIFYCNIKYLKHIVSAKAEAPLQALIRDFTNDKENNTYAYELFNLLIQTSTYEFDEILRHLILRMFDFLSLNYNPKYASRLEATFGGKYYYLDSSFIIRLLGFDGKFRKERSEELIHTLSSIKGVKLIVHEKSIEESLCRVKELIGKNSRLLSQNTKVLKSIFKKDEEGRRNNPVFSLYTQLLDEGRIRNVSDFSIYCENIKARLESLICGIEFDKDALPRNVSEERECVFKELKDKTDKTQKRIKFITILLDYIDSKRASNNYDIADIKYWLVTTDQKTLSIDNQFLSSQKDEYLSNKKSICIMPSELIRLIDGFTGEIRANHIGVFKNYLLKSHVFPREYDENEINTICTIATIVEKTNIENYNVDEMIDRVLNNTSINEIQKRLNKLSKQRERDKELVDYFITQNEDLLGTKLTNIINNARNNEYRKASLRWDILQYILIFGFLLYILWSVINWDYFSEGNIELINIDIWNIIEIFIFVGGVIAKRFTPFVERLKNYYINRAIDKELSRLTKE